MNEPLDQRAASPQEKSEIFERVCRGMSAWHRRQSRWRAARRSALLVVVAAAGFGWWFWNTKITSLGSGNSRVAATAESARQWVAAGQQAGDDYWSGMFVTNSRIDEMVSGGIDVEVLTDDQLLETMRELGQPSILATIDGKRVLISDSL